MASSLPLPIGEPIILYHVRLNTYTLEKGRQKALMLKAEGKKRLEGIKFFITDYPDMILSNSSTITFNSAKNSEFLSYQ